MTSFDCTCDRASIKQVGEKYAEQPIGKGAYDKVKRQRLNDVITDSIVIEGDGGRKKAAWLASQGQICFGLFKQVRVNFRRTREMLGRGGRKRRMRRKKVKENKLRKKLLPKNRYDDKRI